MKKWIKGSLFILTVFLLAACSKYVYYAVGSSNAVSRYSAFAWLPPLNNTKNPYFNNDLADQKIKDQVTADLESKGLRLNARRPDLLVRYTIMVNNKVHTYNEPVYNYMGGFGGRGFYRGGRAYYYGFRGSYPVYVGQEIYHVPYKEGTLIVDLIDKATHKVIWRGYGIGEVDDPQSAVNDLPQVVDGILNKLQLNKITR